jgi:hypothetical protein
MLTRIVAAVCIFLVTSPERRPDLQTFTSPDGVVQMRYSPLLVTCKRGEPTREGELGQWKPQLCDCNDLGERWSTIGCFAYPNDRLKDKPEFLGATLAVSVSTKETKETCLMDPPELVEFGEHAKTVVINGVAFRVYPTHDAAMSLRVGGKLYRTYHNEQCYELSVQTTRRTGIDEPFEPFTVKDAKDVDMLLATRSKPSSF